MKPLVALLLLAATPAVAQVPSYYRPLPAPTPLIVPSAPPTSGMRPVFVMPPNGDLQMMQVLPLSGGGAMIFPGQY